jgi:hypothetical protein
MSYVVVLHTLHASGMTKISAQRALLSGSAYSESPPNLLIMF